MNTPAVPRRGPSRLKLFFWLLVVPAVLITLYFMAVLKWDYSAVERAGWVQKFSKKGGLCKTWEGELSRYAPIRVKKSLSGTTGPTGRPRPSKTIPKTPGS